MPFQLDPLPALDPIDVPEVKIEVVDSDSFTAARRLIQDDPEAKGKTAVLNLASDEIRAGGWLVSLSKTQVGPRVPP